MAFKDYSPCMLPFSLFNHPKQCVKIFSYTNGHTQIPICKYKYLNKSDLNFQKIASE